MSASNVPHFTFSNGVQIPAIGYGTSRAGDHLEEALNDALNCGYRQIDTAYVYNNEKIIGNVLKKFIESGKIARNELFITTKLHSQFHHAEDVEPMLRQQLKNLQLDYADLYLIHVPWGTKKENGNFLPTKDGFIIPDVVDHMETWQALENVYNKGLTRSIGLSNFSTSQLINVHDKSAVKPHCLQLGCHAYWPQEELHALCSKLNIVATAYSPLGSPTWYTNTKTSLQLEVNDKGPVLLDDEKVAEIAEKYCKTSAQILLRWLYQRNINSIPKSVNVKRIKDNIEIFDFELSREDFNCLSSLPVRHRIYGRLNSFSNHPQFIPGENF